jgi:uncharacterized membrane protein
MILEVLATLSAGLFAGAASYINLVEHPARMQCGTTLAVTQFGPSYRRAAVMQASLAAAGSVSAAAVWLMGASLSWLIGGLLLVLVIPFTLLVIFPTNQQLLDPALDKDSQRARRLLIRWGRLHAVRSFLSLVAFVVFLLSLAAPGPNQ